MTLSDSTPKLLRPPVVAVAMSESASNASSPALVSSSAGAAMQDAASPHLLDAQSAFSVQAASRGHRARHVGPPASRQVSSPFSTPSSHLAAEHVREWMSHTPSEQSCELKHDMPTAQGCPHAANPQSRSASAARMPSIAGFWIESVHVAARQSPVVSEHDPLVQSIPAAHEESTAHRAEQTVPPPSTQVSSWFCTPSSQVAGKHTADSHRNETQSACALQLSCTEH